MWYQPLVDNEISKARVAWQTSAVESLKNPDNPDKARAEQLARQQYEIALKKMGGRVPRESGEPPGTATGEMEADG